MLYFHIISGAGTRFGAAARRLSLLVRINLVLGAVLICIAVIAGYSCWTILEVNARREVLAEASLIMASALAMRSYTANEILPLLEFICEVRSSTAAAGCLETLPCRGPTCRQMICGRWSIGSCSSSY